MKFAICNELYEGWDPRTAMRHAYGLGYRGWEIAPYTLSDDIEHFSEKERTDYHQMATDEGLEIVGLHWLLAKTTGLHLTHDEPATRSATADYLGQLSGLCRDLGGKVMVLGSPQQRNLSPKVTFNEALDRAASVLRSVTGQLADDGVVLAIEPLGPEETNFITTAEQAKMLIQAIDSPQVQLLLDVKAMATEKKDIADIVEENFENLVHFHANDPNRQGPGMGSIDFGPIFQKLTRHHYDGWVSVEVFDYSPGVETLARSSIDYMRQVLDASASDQ